MISDRKNVIQRLVCYHRSMPMETDECFDRLTQSYVEQLEEDQENLCLKLIDYFDRYLIQEHDDIDHIHLRRLQSDFYLQLSHVSRPYQSQFYYNQHKKIFHDNERLMNLYKNVSSQ